jgi:hypothetical protein
VNWLGSAGPVKEGRNRASCAVFLLCFALVGVSAPVDGLLDVDVDVDEGVGVGVVGVVLW